MGKVRRAQDSVHVEKAREKLKQKIEQEHQLITDAALHRVSGDIKNWISRHSRERIKMKRDVSLFDGNKHPAKVHSRYVKDLLQQLAEPIPPKNENNLEGRISEIG